MKPDPFVEITRLIQEAKKPFPIVEIRRLAVRATSHAPVTPELADAIARLNATIHVLAEVMEEIDVDAVYSRHDALNALGRLRRLCGLSAPH